MKISIEDFLKNGYVISVDPIQAEYCKRIFNSILGKCPNVIMFEKSNDIKDRMRECSMSHAKIIRIAKEKNLDFVVIFEDDVFPTEQFSVKYFQEYLNDIPDNSNGISLGRLYKFNSKNNINDHFFNSNEYVNGSHCYIVFNKAYDLFIEYLTNSIQGKISKNNFIRKSFEFMVADEFNIIDHFYHSYTNFFIQLSHDSNNRMNGVSAGSQILQNHTTFQKKRLLYIKSLIKKDLFDEIYSK